MQYAFRSSGEDWQTTTIDSGGTTGQYNSLAIGADKSLHVSYLDSTTNGIKYATRAVDGEWGTTVIGPATVGPTALALAGDTVHVAYRGDSAQLQHAWLSPGKKWQVSEIQSGLVTGDLSLVSDSSGGLHVSFYDSGQQFLRYARRPADTDPWTIETIDPAPGTGKFVALAADSTGGVHASYQYKTGFVLRYAYRCP